MADRQVTSLQRIVRSLDDAMNNTSLLLLLDVAGQRLLFPGDAQIENWSFALSEPATTALLRDVTLYKVGHHGSRNGTPRSLVRLWQQHPIRRTSVLSTLPGVHGKTEGTQVPRTTLVEALGGLGTVHRTDELPEGEHYLELECRPPAAEWVRRPVAPGLSPGPAATTSADVRPMSLPDGCAPGPAAGAWSAWKPQPPSARAPGPPGRAGPGGSAVAPARRPSSCTSWRPGSGSGWT